jgi:murein DD-endopeptidase MepM/ murein hydrolase activator NlpD
MTAVRGNLRDWQWPQRWPPGLALAWVVVITVDAGSYPERAIARQDRSLALVQRTVATVTPTAATSSPWQGGSFPVEDFVAYTSPFGYRQHPYGGYRFHYGLDIAAPSGSYIRAWWGGQVVEVTDDTACGTSVVIESDQWLHIYCHMQGHRVIESDGDRWLIDAAGGLKIRQGDSVEAGQPIGRVGLTGRTTGPHLHWGLKYQGTWVDPARVLQAMVAAQQQAVTGN